jgi:hypothetical protein
MGKVLSETRRGAKTGLAETPEGVYVPDIAAAGGDASSLLVASFVAVAASSASNGNVTIGGGTSTCLLFAGDI